MKPSKLQAVVRGTLFSYVLTALLLTALAFLLYRFRLGESQVSLESIWSTSSPAWPEVFWPEKQPGRGVFLWGLLTGILYFLILFFASFAVSRELGAGSRELLTVFLMCAGSGTIGGW